MKHIAEFQQFGHAAALRFAITSLAIGVAIGLTPTLTSAHNATAPDTLVSIGNRVWHDVNNDGVVSAGENGINGVVLSLYRDNNASGVFDAGDTLISSQSTGNGGYYAFNGLEQSSTPAKRYLVVVEGSNFCVGGALSELVSSTGSVDGDSDLNNTDHGIDRPNDSCGVSVSSSAVTLLYLQEPVNDGDTDNTSNLTLDFGFYKPTHTATPTATATATATATPTHTATPTPTSTATATATATATNSPTSTSTPSPTSTSTSTASPTSTPTASPTAMTGPTTTPTATPTSTPQVADTPAPTPSPTLTPPGISSPTPTSTASSTPVVEPPLLAGLGNYVWVDSDKDGLQSPLEQGLAGISITLSFGGQIVSSTHTGLTGFYSFTNLVPGEYTVCFSLPAGYTFTVPGTDPNSDQDSNADINTGCAAPVTLTAGEFNPTIDAGVHAAPTAITLQRFEVSRITQAGRPALQVEWQTGLEANTFGFHILRGPSEDIGKASQVNAALIAAKGRDGGAAYTWIDEDATDNTPHYYWLREVELSGNQIDYGPATFAAQDAGTDITAKAPAKAPVASSTPAPISVNASVQAGGAVMVSASATPGARSSAPVAAPALPNAAQSTSAQVPVVVVTVATNVVAQMQAPAPPNNGMAQVQVPVTAPNSVVERVIAIEQTDAPNTATSNFVADSERDKSGGPLENQSVARVEFSPTTEHAAVATAHPQRVTVNVALGNNRQLVQASSHVSVSSTTQTATLPPLNMLWITGTGLSVIGVVFMGLALMRRRTR